LRGATMEGSFRKERPFSFVAESFRGPAGDVFRQA
jgi:hypothetical protein